MNLETLPYCGNLLNTCEALEGHKIMRKIADFLELHLSFGDFHLHGELMVNKGLICREQICL